MTDDVEPEKSFYKELYGWKSNDIANDIDRDQKGSYTLFQRDDGVDSAGVVKRQFRVADSSVAGSCIADSAAT